MKQTTTKSLTKRDVENILDKKLKNYPTKDDLDERFIKFTNAFRAENNYKLDVMKQEILTSMSKFTNMVLTAIDPIMKYVDERREEKEVEAYQLHETREKLDDREKRIKKLEQS